MSMTDPVGDMLTRIRNASRAGHEKVVLPGSKLKERIANVLKDEGFIRDVVLHREEKKSGEITLVLKYGPLREPAITEIRRVSRPGLRRYVPSAEIPRVLNGMGIAIVSTSKGILVDRECRKQKVGGELICTVY
ncbi:MAG TPA: 30S ribosomal protein S8 [Myxococcales bacterium]|jgi:small subunit ribosomal protein S8|nr:30S ribosomal protein S8 [Myxococcales bacterium]